MAFLTVVTRSYKRPQALARCVQSVACQSDPDVEHVIVHDALGRGIGWSQENLRNVPIGGEWVYVLDDDDYLIDDRFIENLKVLVAERNPEVVFVKMDMLWSILPPKTANGPLLGQIAVSCFVVKRAVWLEHVNDFQPIYEGDYTFIRAVWDCEKRHRRAWLDRVVARVGQVSHGQPENSHLVADGLSPA